MNEFKHHTKKREKPLCLDRDAAVLRKHELKLHS